MLYLLTGNIQTGKTRWLQDEIARLADEGVVSYGVIAPGDWVASDGPHADANGFEKLGIWNVLLPDGERIRFADRRDIAEAQGLVPAQEDAAKCGLGWFFRDEAIARANAHFASIPDRVRENDGAALLVVDELGFLELNRGAGLIEAMALLERGPHGAMQDALVVVRADLMPLAEERFAEKWGGSARIGPGDSVRVGSLPSRAQ